MTTNTWTDADEYQNYWTCFDHFDASLIGLGLERVNDPDAGPEQLSEKALQRCEVLVKVFSLGLTGYYKLPEEWVMFTSVESALITAALKRLQGDDSGISEFNAEALAKATTLKDLFVTRETGFCEYSNFSEGLSEDKTQLATHLMTELNAEALRA